jgi:hypothetical protein
MVYRKILSPYICLKYEPRALNMTGCHRVRTLSTAVYIRHLLG